MAGAESKGSRRYDKENLLWQSTVAIRSDPVGSQRRLDMSPEERAATPPWETESFPENRQIVRFSVAIPKGVKPSSNGRYNAGADNAGSVTDGHESRELTPKSAAPIRRFAQSISKSGTKSPRDFLIVLGGEQNEIF